MRYEEYAVECCGEMPSAQQLILWEQRPWCCCCRAERGYFLLELGPPWFKADCCEVLTLVRSCQFGGDFNILTSRRRRGPAHWWGVTSLSHRRALAAKERAHPYNPILALRDFFAVMLCFSLSTHIRALLPKGISLCCWCVCVCVSIGRNCFSDSFDSIRWIYRGALFGRN